MKKNLVAAFAAIALIAIIFYRWVEHPKPTIDQYVEQYQSQNPLSGTILVAKDDTILYQKAFGYANKEKDIKNTLDSKFLIASITKEFTAAGILYLAEKGLIDLNKPISAYIPAKNPFWDNKMPDWANQITIHHLLSHSSGLPEYVSLPNFGTFYDKPHTTKELIQFFSNHPLIFTSGTKYDYSGSGYNMLGAIIEIVSGKSYATFLKDTFFDPLYLSNIYASHSQLLDQLIQEDATISLGYNWDASSKTQTRAGNVNLSTAFAEASIIADVTDLYKALYALYNYKIISEQSLAKMVTPYFLLPDDLSVGYGVYIDKSLGFPIYVHTGIINGYEGIALYEPTKRITVIILENLRGANIFEFGYRLMKYAYESNQ